MRRSCPARLVVKRFGGRPAGYQSPQPDRRRRVRQDPEQRDPDPRVERQAEAAAREAADSAQSQDDVDGERDDPVHPTKD
jgi:hypothetical protein